MKIFQISNMKLKLQPTLLYNWIFLLSMTLVVSCGDDANNDASNQTSEKEVKKGDPHSYSQLDHCSVHHMKLVLRTDFAKKSVTGTVRYDFDLKQGNQLILDVKDLDIHKVYLEDRGGPGLQYQVSQPDPILGSSLTITLPENHQNHVHVVYSSRPSSAAVQWLDAHQTKDKKLPFMYTQGQAILTRTWIPCQDSPGARVTYDADIKVPSQMMAVMSAKNPTQKDPQGKYAFTMPQPIPPYLIALAVGEFEFAPVGPETGVYAEPSVLDAAVYEFGKMQKMLDAAEELYGPYQWERYDVLVLPPSFPFGGMENPRLTFVTPTILAGDRSLTALIAHELAHSWSGNLVTNATWDDFWLNEGFTVYFERRIMEEIYGEEYMNMLALLGYQDLEHEVDDLGEHSHDTHLKLDLTNRDPDDGMTDIAYEKGAYFLTLLEEKVGREKFDAFLKKYFADHKFKTMNTEDFVTYLKKELIQPNNLEVNLEDWIYGPGIPDNVPKPSSDRFQKVEDTYALLKDGKLPSSQITSKWTTHEWLHFLRYLPESLDRKVLLNMDQTYELTNSGNSEIQAAWFEYALNNGMGDHIEESLSEFLIRVGRRKFLTPLYRAMVENDMETEAKEIYEQARPNYHSVSRNTLDKLLKSS